MSKITFQKNSDGFRALATGPESQALIKNATEMVAGRCGEGFRAYMSTVSRARGYVDSDTAAARKRQVKDHVVEKSLGQGIGL